MKNGIKRMLVTALTLVMALGMLAGCGAKGPTAEDAQAYVKAVLDYLCTGDYDHSVNLADIEEGSGTRDELINEITRSLSEDTTLSDDLTAEFTDVIIDAFSKAKYTVGDAVETEDGGFDVTVTMEPLKLISLDEEELMSEIQTRVMADAEKVAAMSEDEQTNYVVKILVEIMKKGLENPSYDEPEDVVVHYGALDESNTFGCSSEEGEKLGSKIFSMSGLE